MTVIFILTEGTQNGAQRACERACEKLREGGHKAELIIENSFSDNTDDIKEACAIAELINKINEGLTCKTEKEKGKEKGKENEKETVLAPDAYENILYITDSAHLLRDFREKDLPCVALSHTGNADEKFDGAPYVFSEPDEVDTDSYVKAYERMAGLPWTVLETKRCLIRETTVDDVDDFYEIYKDPSMTKYMEGLFENPEDEKRYMRDYIKNVYALLGFGVWSVIEKESGSVIGRAGFSIRNGFESPELGFLIGVKWQGRGYAQEVLKDIIAYGRNVLGFKTVHALVREGNEESLHILEKLGFSRLGSVKAEEDIYEGAYPEGGAWTLPRHVKYGAYIELLLEI